VCVRFFGSITAVVWTFQIALREGIESVMHLLLLIGATAVAIVVTRFVGSGIGRFISSFILGGKRRPAHLRDPLRKADTLQKFTDQCWQLVIHVSMAALEAYVMADEEWWSDPRTCWIPSPAQQTLKASARWLYLSQLAIWVCPGLLASSALSPVECNTALVIVC
jgi:hypothetical protein